MSLHPISSQSWTVYAKIRFKGHVVRTCADCRSPLGHPSLSAGSRGHEWWARCTVTTETTVNKDATAGVHRDEGWM